MQFLREPVEVAEAALVARLLELLEGGKTVLWLVTGGSSIPAEARIMAKLLGHEAKLHITLTDERYGPVGHGDSNWQQLLDAGFEGGEAALYPVLQTGFSLSATAQMFGMTLHDCFAKADVVIGQLGMGADGHTAGILPETMAAKMKSGLAIGYETPEFKRVTATFEAIKRFDEAFCMVYGDAKAPALRRLKDEVPLVAQPAQIWKSIKTTYVYNDQVGENT